MAAKHIAAVLCFVRVANIINNAVVSALSCLREEIYLNSKARAVKSILKLLYLLPLRLRESMNITLKARTAKPIPNLLQLLGRQSPRQTGVR
jgi:hypothetical protein